jgi:predicted dehydrogenase
VTALRVAVIGAGAFGKNHVRAIRELDGVQLVGVFDANGDRAAQVAAEASVPALPSLASVFEEAQCAIVATPTTTHEAIVVPLLEKGLDVLVEKPIAHSAEAGFRMAKLASDTGRMLQVGHLERFNPAVEAAGQMLTHPLFFEIHRLSVFTPRSLDIDVVLDLMIHDLDIVLAFVKEEPSEIRAAGISVLSPLVDIANVRLAFPSGCIANLTASRVSTEKVRKLRLFQPGEYISVDYARQDAFRIAVGKKASNQFVSEILPVNPGEPLKRELQGFFEAVRTRTQPLVDGFAAARALQIGEQILAKIGEHSKLVSDKLRAAAEPTFSSEG